MIVNDPEAGAEVERAFAAYEQALVSNDVDALDGFFWSDLFSRGICWCGLSLNRIGSNVQHLRRNS